MRQDSIPWVCVGRCVDHMQHLRRGVMYWRAMHPVQARGRGVDRVRRSVRVHVRMHALLGLAGRSIGWGG